MRIGLLPFVLVLVGAPVIGADRDAVRAIFRGNVRPPLTDEKTTLGRRLFFDAALNRHGDRSCATCHRPEQAWSDGLARARGRDGKSLRRKTPTLFDVGVSPSFFWDGRASSLEMQVLGPLENPDEMDTPVGEAMRYLESQPEYRTAFRQVFGHGADRDSLAAALAAFVRTITSPALPFDRWVAGDENALSPRARRGLALFAGKAQCHICHRGSRLTTDAFHFIGLTSEDAGMGGAKNDSLLNGMFKVPTLRFVAARAPYMHDGSIATLEAVVDFYDRGGDRGDNGNGLPAAIRPLGLSKREKGDLVTFLKSLGGGRSR